MDTNNENNSKESPGKFNPGDRKIKEQKEGQPRDQNPNWDQAQRRQQASPRSYTTNVDAENVENQNSQAHKEQIEHREEENHNPPENENEKGGKLLGDKISKRQQTIDEKDPPGDRKEE